MPRPNNLTINDSSSWVNLFAVTDATAIAGLSVLILGAGGKMRVIGFWNGAGAIDLTKYNTTPGLPIGTIIHDFQVYKAHYKTAASTWKSSAAAT